MLQSRSRVRPGPPLWPLLLGVAASVAAPWPLLAAEPPGGQPVPQAAPLVSLDWHGELRSRLDYLDGVRWTTSDPSVAAHLDVRHGETSAIPGNGALGNGDLRLRLEPALHVAEWAEIRSQIDGVGNLTLGGQSRAGLDTQNPANQGLNQSGQTVSLAAMNNQGQLLQQWTSPTGGAAAVSRIGVRRAWVHVRVLGMGEVDIGRMGDHFGLGMVRNDGRDAFADFQSDLDRIALSAELFGFRLRLARDILFDGPLNTTALTGGNVLTRGSNATLTQGRAYPLQDSAEASRWLLQGENVRPAEALGLRWAAAVMYQSQDNAFFAEHGDCAAQQSCDLLLPRLVRQFTPQFYLDWRGRLGGAPLRLQLEGVFRYGTVQRADERLGTDTAKSLVGGGFASRGEWRRGRSAWQFDLGMASGDRMGGFGVNDQDNWRYAAAADAAPRSLVTGYSFHRGFLVDNLLFRDIIGAVANAWYFKPSLKRYLFETAPDQGLSVQAGVMTAFAASDNATPGKASFLGVEPHAALGWNTGVLTAVTRATYLMPGAALDAPSGARAQPVWRLEAALRMGF